MAYSVLKDVASEQALSRKAGWICSGSLSSGVETLDRMDFSAMSLARLGLHRRWEPSPGASLVLSKAM